jgi:hypothetical protein
MYGHALSLICDDNSTDFTRDVVAKCKIRKHSTEYSLVDGANKFNLFFGGGVEAELGRVARVEARAHR